MPSDSGRLTIVGRWGTILMTPLRDISPIWTALPSIERAAGIRVVLAATIAPIGKQIQNQGERLCSG